jgi:hypothetical protein
VAGRNPRGGVKGQDDRIHEFSEVDYTGGLGKIDKPTLIIHRGDDRIVFDLFRTDGSIASESRARHSDAVGEIQRGMEVVEFATAAPQLSKTGPPQAARFQQSIWPIPAL